MQVMIMAGYLLLLIGDFDLRERGYCENKKIIPYQTNINLQNHNHYSP